MGKLKDQITTIKITNENHQKLLELKEHPRETFNDVITRIVGVITKHSQEEQ